MLRRGYNFTDGSNALGRLDAGLFFIAFVRDPDVHYIPMQTRLSAQDGLMEYLQHTGSGLWAVPPGVRRPTGFDRRHPLRLSAGQLCPSMRLGARSPQSTSKGIPAACRRGTRLAAIAWAVVTWPEVVGLSSRSRHSADSASILAVSV